MNRYLLLIIHLCLVLRSYSQEIKVHVYGVNNEPLAGATIATDHGLFAFTNVKGEAILKCQCDSLIVNVSFVGYQGYQQKVSMTSDLRIVLALSNLEMDEVEVNAQSDKERLQESSSAVSFSMESVSQLPYLLGERDPIKFIQTKTGVSTGTDGNNGYYVRGGGIDQNAIELDHMEFYNTNHLLGFFSMFSAEVIDRADFMKAGYPAHVGGRLSSALQLHSQSPNVNEVSGSVSLGLLAANLNLQVPVVQEKSGLMISYRRSYLDLITQNLFAEGSAVQKSTNYRFSDATVKYEHRMGQNHTLSLIGFTGGDFNNYQSSRTFSNQIEWNTWNVGLNLKSILNPTTDLEFYVNTGHFKQNFQASISSFGIDLNSDIQNLKSGLLLYYSHGAHEWVYGLSWINRRFKPSQVDINTGSDVFALDNSDYIYTSEWSASVDDNWQLNDRWRVGAGLRLSGFVHWGPFDRYLLQESEVVDTLSNLSGEVVKTYLGLEPRFRVNYLMNSSTSWKLSYDRTYQYIHLSPLSSVSLPTDLWVPSTSIVKPQNAHQLTFGYYKILDQWGVNYSAEVFGKLLNNQMEWRNGTIAGYSDSPNFDYDFIFGKGYSYGLEFSMVKKKGMIGGELNYTLSRTKRRFDEVNQGDFFPAKYDRIHDLSLVGSLYKGPWTFSGLFKLASGTALTLPTAKYLIGERVISDYSKRNELRMPTYHRLDVSAVLKPKKHPNVEWAFSIYNVYNHGNPYFIYFDVQGDVDDYSLDVNLEQVSLFPILPSVSYQLDF